MDHISTDMVFRLVPLKPKTPLLVIPARAISCLQRSFAYLARSGQAAAVAYGADRGCAGVRLASAGASQRGDQAAPAARRALIFPSVVLEPAGHPFLLELTGEAVGCPDPHVANPPKGE